MNPPIEDPVDAKLLQVVVYRHGEVVDRQSCDSREEAAAVVARLEEEEGVTCEIVAAAPTVHARSDDIEKPDDPDDVVDPIMEAGFDDEYR